VGAGLSGSHSPRPRAGDWLGRLSLPTSASECSGVSEAIAASAEDQDNENTTFTELWSVRGKSVSLGLSPNFWFVR